MSKLFFSRRILDSLVYEGTSGLKNNDLTLLAGLSDSDLPARFPAENLF